MRKKRECLSPGCLNPGIYRVHYLNRNINREILTTLCVICKDRIRDSFDIKDVYVLYYDKNTVRYNNFSRSVV